MSKIDQASVFAALGEPMRLQLLTMIGDGQSISQLARGLPITRQAVSRHLRVLERAELIEARRKGRETQFVARSEGLVEAKKWLDEVAQQWDTNLNRLKILAENGPQND